MHISPTKYKFGGYFKHCDILPYCFCFLILNYNTLLMGDGYNLVIS